MINNVIPTCVHAISPIIKHDTLYMKLGAKLFPIEFLGIQTNLQRHLHVWHINDPVTLLALLFDEHGHVRFSGIEQGGETLLAGFYDRD